MGKPRKKLLAHYVDFDGRGALVRASASNAKVQVRSASDVRGTYYLVRLDVQDDKGARTMKYGGKERDPDQDFAIPTDVQKAADGSWLLTPTTELKSGEYGVFTSRAQDRPGAPDSIVLYEFGVDERPSSIEVAASAGTPVPGGSPSTAEAACQSNFKTEGGYWKGQSFLTSFPVPRQSEGNAFETLVQALAGSSANWQITSSSKEVGLIAATEEMAEIMGHKSLKANLKILLKKDAASGSQKIEMNFLVPSGTKAPEKGVRTVFCVQIAAKLDGSQR